ncbi:MAG: hypothetical protein Q8847_02665, partial [Sweet potato little leaf phytoplasma]|nr:hypothetical protein [Sweet potato little leaf phytoplasma]
GHRSIARKIFKPRAVDDGGSTAQNRGKQHMIEDHSVLQPIPQAPKRRQKGKGKAPMEAMSEVPRKFVGEVAAARYEELKNREIMLEKGFDENLNSLPHMLAVTIRNQNWQNLCHHPEPAVPSIVKEFYANFQDNGVWKTMVRGQIVEWSPSTINQFYDIPDFPFAICNAMVIAPSEEQLKATLQYCAIEGASWKQS